MKHRKSRKPEPRPQPASEPRPDDGLPMVSPDGGEEALADEIDNSVPAFGYDMLPVVGLGASAGGIQALKLFLEHTPDATGNAFVVVMHLAPGHASVLPELLQRHTGMPVRVVTDAVEMEANHVYVIPPAMHLTAMDGQLRLTPMQPEQGKRVTVDLFFRSLADTHGPHATAIVLSGADGDGAVGLKRIKERGGLTIAQDPVEAEHMGMPTSAIATGMVDWVLPAGEMASRIQAYQQTGSGLRLPPEHGPQPAKRTQQPLDESEALLREVLTFLRMRTGRDFSYYKRATIVRRIARRMQVSGTPDLSEYLSHLRTNPGEAGALLQDLLISVTNFFRDREAFEAVERHIPELFRNKQPGDEVRVWCAACATGEEVYSLAMLLLEHARQVNSPATIHLFGCDLDDAAIQTARAGFYPDSIAADVSEERLRRFFIKEPTGYRVRREVRELVLFASHDLLKDAPFSRMDLVSCRNLLIYLNRDAQTRALQIFHFALRPGAVLFLGASETVPEESALFEPVDKKHRLYRRQAVANSSLPMALSSGETAIDRVLLHHERLRTAHAVLPDRVFLANFPPPLPGFEHGEGATPADAIHFKLLGRFGPPSVVVNAEHEIVHLSENANRFLQFPEGAPTRNLVRLIHPMLRVDMRAALLRANETGEPVDVLRRLVDLPGGPRAVDVHVSPGGKVSPAHLLVLFAEHEPGSPESAEVPALRGTLEPEAVVQQLERELTRAKAHLRDTVERHEASTEELRASNEELQALNEELRSAGEELETGREELQSVNEELTSLNAEYKGRAEELARANSDLHNLMNATQIATLFLGRELQVMRFTPAAVPLFNLLPQDAGRPITDLTRRIEYPELIADAEQVLRTLVPIERELREGTRSLLARVLPYRTVEEDHIGGVVFTFVDVTERRRAEDALRDSAQRSAEEADAMTRLHEVGNLCARREIGFDLWLEEILGAAIALTRADKGNIQLLDEGTGALTIAAHRGFHEPFLKFFASVNPGEPAACGAAMRDGGRVMVEDVTQSEIFAGQPSLDILLGAGVRAVHSTPLVSSGGQVLGMISTHFSEAHRSAERQLRLIDLLARQASDYLERRRAEAALAAEKYYAESIVETLHEPLLVLNPDLTVRSVNPAFYTHFGVSPADTIGRRVYDLGNGQWNIPALRTLLEDVLPDSNVFNDHEVTHEFETLGRRVMLVNGRRLDHVQLILLGIRDITERTRADEAVRESEHRLRTLSDEVPQLIWTNRGDGVANYFNKRWYEYTGLTFEQSVGGGWEAIVHPEDAAASKDRWQQALAAGEGFVSEYRLRGADGEYRWFIGRNVPLRDTRGTVTGWFGTATDIHDLRLVTAALQAGEEKLREADRRKDEFLATLAHELRNPLAPVRVGLEIMKLKANDAHAAEKVRSMMERQISRMTHLIDDLLDLSRVSQGQMALQTTRLQLADAIQDGVDIAQPLIDERQHELVIELPSEPIELDADRTRLAQVFGNLLHNAATYTKNKGRIRLSAQRDGGDVLVTVEDNGIGIPAPMLRRVFEMFVRVDHSLEKSESGLGIGLSIVKRLVEMHGGRITAESDGQDRGSRFVVRLPVALSDVSAEPTRGGDAMQESVPRRILVVDDNRDAADSLAMLLDTMGHATHIAHNGLEAMKAAEAFRPDLIFMDIGMPGLNGYDACRRIREQPWGRNMMIVALTGWGQHADARKAQVAGFNLHVVKPVHPTAVHKILSRPLVTDDADREAKKG